MALVSLLLMMYCKIWIYIYDFYITKYLSLTARDTISYINRYGKNLGKVPVFGISQGAM